MVDGVAAGVADVERRVVAACERVGRARGDVTVVAVSKFHDDDAVRAAYDVGVRDFGESYPQALRDRTAALPDLDDVRWHFIGTLQTNKAQYVARSAAAFHALDRVEVAEALGRRLGGRVLECFVEVDVAGEATKAGVAPADVAALVTAARRVDGIDVVGLMCMPPLAAHPDDNRPHFRRLRELAAELGLTKLSMGTTADFEVAVEEGATHVRVGRTIFGDRPARPPG